MQYDLPQNYVEMVKAEKEAGIKKGWDAVEADWRSMALKLLMEVALTHRTFTVNDFGDKVRQSEIKTHDYRALGGLMVTAKKLKIIKPSGQTIPSLISHGMRLQVWESLIFKPGAQAPLF